MTLKRPIFGICLIALITLVIYIPAMRAGFIWDDDKFLTENPLIKADDGLYRFWCTTEAPDYFPLTSTTLWLEWRLWGENAKGYHVVNVLLHILSSILIWRVLKRLKVPGAWLSGLVFAVHPVNVESVAWITERKNTLPMMFYMLSILLYLRFESDERRWFYGLSLGSFLLALLSKTSVVMMPFVLLGCAWWQRKRIVPRDILRVAPFFSLSGILALVTIFFQYHRAIGEGIVRTDSFLSRLAIAGQAVWFYLYKAILPHKLSFVYPRWEVDSFTVVSFIPGLLLMGLLILFWFYRGSWSRPFLFGLGYYVVTLFPVLGFFDIYFMKYSLVADHWQYISIIGIIALSVGLGNYIYYGLQKVPRHLAIIAAVFLVCLLSLLTWRQGHIYKNVETLWHHTIANNPQCWMAHNNLGYALAGQDRTAEAIKHYYEALRIKPDLEEVYYNLANALAAQGKLDEAISRYNKALELKPDFVKVYINLGNALAAEGKLDEAISQYYEALRIRPDFEEAHYNLGKALATQGKLDEAISHYYEALRVRPDFEEAHYNLANALAAKGKLDEATSHYYEALRIRPDSAEAHISLSNTFLSQGKLDEAISHYYEALRIRPDSVEAHVSLGNVLAAQGKLDEATSHYYEALRIRPDSVEAHNNLGASLIRSGNIDQAIFHFREALRTRPDYANAKKNLKTALAAMGKRKDPITELQQALMLNPRNPTLHYKLGILYQRQGQLDVAVDQYKKALSIQPGFFMALSKLAMVHTIKIEYEKALSIYKEMIGLRPDTTETYYNIACLYAKQNKIEESVDWLKKAIKRGYDNWDLIKTDEDLENVRGSLPYKELIRGH